MKSVLIVIITCFALSTFSQKYNFTNYTVEDGLAQSQINDINQDKFGYLWIGTESGLSKFNGHDFVNYSMGNGLPDNKIERIYFDPQDQLWVGTPKGLGLYKDDKFIPYYFPEPLRVNDIASFNDQIYVATNKGLYFKKKDLFELVPFKKEKSNLYVRALVNYENQKLICGSRTGIYAFDGSQYEVFIDSSFLQYNISDLDLRENELYISTFGDGILKFNLKNETLKNYDLKFNRIRSTNIHNGIILSASISGGIEYSNKNATYFTTENGLVNERLVCTFIDRENNYWFGTDGNGLLKFLGKSVTSYSEDDGLSSNIVMSISQNRDSSFVFGSYREGLSIINFDSGKKIYKTEKNGLNDNSVWTTAIDGEGRCWIGTSEGVNCLRSGKLIDNTVTKNINTKVRSILITENYFFFGGAAGLYTYNGDEVEHIESTTFMNINHLSYNNDELYVGARNGLFRLTESSKFQEVDTLQLPENNINSVLIDNRKNLWVGTENGLFIQFPDQEKMVSFDLDVNDFKSRTILGLLQSTSGDVWVSTMSGVYKIKGSKKSQFEYNLFHYGTAEGIVNLESNHNAIYEDHSGKIWVGTSSALTRIDPTQDDRLFSFKSPVLHFTAIRLFMESFDYDRFKVSYDKNKEIPSKITLPYDQNHLTFDYIGINLKSPESVLYEYRLVGAHGSWSPLTSAMYATYSDISPGDYEFEVRATNKTFMWSSTKKISITILPPFWSTWWFITSMFMLGFLILMLIFQFRIRAIKQRQENERLNFKNRLLFLEQQSLNASMNRHFIFNSLNSIQYFINSSDKISANKYLSSFAKLIRKNLDSSTTNNFIISLQEEIERIELYLSLEKMRFQNKFDYEINVASSLDTEGIEIPSMILQPFVENSIIHGVLPLEDRQGNIKVDIYEQLGDVVFEVSDDGVGIENTLGLKKETQSGDHESKGMEITNRRIDLLRKLTGDNLLIIGPYQINDKEGKAAGTKVIIKMGLNLADET